MDHNGLIDQQDPIFAALQIWEDRNANGLSEDEELSHLSDLGVTGIAPEDLSHSSPVGAAVSREDVAPEPEIHSSRLTADSYIGRVEILKFGQGQQNHRITKKELDGRGQRHVLRPTEPIFRNHANKYHCQGSHLQKRSWLQNRNGY